MQYKLDLWSKYGFDLKRLLLPQLPLDRHLNSYPKQDVMFTLLTTCGQQQLLLNMCMGIHIAIQLDYPTVLYR